MAGLATNRQRLLWCEVPFPDQSAIASTVRKRLSTCIAYCRKRNRKCRGLLLGNLLLAFYARFESGVIYQNCQSQKRGRYFQVFFVYLVRSIVSRRQLSHHL